MIIEYHASINQPDFTQKDYCFVIYSPENITIKPRQDTYLDLKFNMDFKNLPDDLEYLPQLWLKLSSTFKMMGLFIEESEEWVSNRTKNNTIQLHLLNRSHYDVKIEKDDVLGYIFLLSKLSHYQIEPLYKILNVF